MLEEQVKNRDMHGDLVALDWEFNSKDDSYTHELLIYPSTLSYGGALHAHNEMCGYFESYQNLSVDAKRAITH